MVARWPPEYWKVAKRPNGSVTREIFSEFLGDLVGNRACLTQRIAHRDDSKARIVADRHGVACGVNHLSHENSPRKRSGTISHAEDLLRAV